MSTILVSVSPMASPQKPHWDGCEEHPGSDRNLKVALNPICKQINHIVDLRLMKEKENAQPNEIWQEKGDIKQDNEDLKKENEALLDKLHTANQNNK